MSTSKGKFQPAGIGMTPAGTELGSFIRERRLENDMRQVLLAQEAGLADGLVSQIEVGERKYLDTSQLEGLAKALKCNVEELRKRMPIKHVAKPTTEIGKFIRSRREELGLSLEAFAEKMKISPQKAKLWEVRKNPHIHYNSLKPLATALEVDVSTLSQFVGTKQKVTTSGLGQLIRTRRKELGISLELLAEKLDCSRQFINQIELGVCRLSENNDKIVKLAETLDLDVEKLKAVRPERKRNHVCTENTSLLGKFLAKQRQEHHLAQREVAERAKVSISLISNIETGNSHPTLATLERVARVLDCQIPLELLPSPKQRKLRAKNYVTDPSSVLCPLSELNVADLKRIKELSDIHENTEAVRKGMKLLRRLLEKQNDNWTICLHKDGHIVEFEMLL